MKKLLLPVLASLSMALPMSIAKADCGALQQALEQDGSPAALLYAEEVRGWNAALQAENCAVRLEAFNALTAEQSMVSPEVEAEASPFASEAPMRRVSIDALEGTAVIGNEGEIIGHIEDVVEIEGERRLVLALGESDERVTLQIENIAFEANSIYLEKVSTDEVMNRPRFQEGDGVPVERFITTEIPDRQ